MARIAVLSDVHGNIEALEAVLSACGRERVEAVLHLGDLVGYGGSPAACVRRLREGGASCVLGNHDRAAFDPRALESFNALAAEAIRWTASRLPESDLAWLSGLPETTALNGAALLCHGSPHDPDAYLVDRYAARRAFAALDARSGAPALCLFGHTHHRHAWLRDPRGKVTALSPAPRYLFLDAAPTLLVNPGAVGQPRGGDPRAHFAVLDTAEGVIFFHAVPYDVASAQRRIIAAGLPEYLAERLALGR